MQTHLLRVLALSILTMLATQLAAQTPVIHLMMDEEGTGTVSDQTGKRNHADVIGGVQFVEDRFGNECRAVLFDGYTGYLTVPHRRSLNLNSNFTITAWTKIPYGLTLQGLQWLTLVCKGEHPEETDFSPAFRAQLTSATASVNTASTKSIGSIRQGFPTGQWFHVAIVYDGDEMLIYQDGRETARFALRDPIYTNNEPLNIGRDIPGNVEYFEGYMDDLRLFNQALSSNEVQKVFRDDSYKNLGSACPKPSAPPTPPIAQNTPPPSPTPTNIPNFGGMKEYEEPAPPVPADPAPPRPTTPRPDPITPQNIPDDPAPDPVSEPNDPEPIDPINPPDPVETEPEDPIEEEPVEPEEIEEEPEEPPVDPNSFEGIATNNLTLVLDVSGSMNQPNKLPLLKEAFLELLKYMREADRISIVTFSGGVDLVLDGEPATKIKKIQEAIDDLNSSGITRGKKGMRVAHRVALKHYIPKGNNRVILATDAAFNIVDLHDIAGEMSQDGITLSVFSFGRQDQYRNIQLEELAEHGNGNHVRVNPNNAYTALRSEMHAVKE